MKSDSWIKNVYCLQHLKMLKMYTLTILKNDSDLFRVMKAIVSAEGEVIEDNIISRVFIDEDSAVIYVEKLGERKKKKKGYVDVSSSTIMSVPLTDWILERGDAISKDQEDSAQDVSKSNSQYVVQVDDNSYMKNTFSKGVTYVAEKIKNTNQYMLVYDNFGEGHRLDTARLSNIGKIKIQNITEVLNV